MKTIKLLLLSVFIISFSSCSKDDDGGGSFEIVGNWRMTEGAVEGGSIMLDLGGMPIPVEVSGTFIDLDDQNKLTIKEDNTFTSITGNIAIELHMNVMGTVQTETFEASDIFGEGTWERTGNTLNITNDNGTTIPYTIVSLTESNLELKANVSEMDAGTGSNPMLESLDINVRMKFVRL